MNVGDAQAKHDEQAASEDRLESYSSALETWWSGRADAARALLRGEFTGEAKAVDVQLAGAVVGDVVDALMDPKRYDDVLRVLPKIRAIIDSARSRTKGARTGELRARFALVALNLICLQWDTQLPDAEWQQQLDKLLHVLVGIDPAFATCDSRFGQALGRVTFGSTGGARLSGVSLEHALATISLSCGAFGDAPRTAKPKETVGKAVERVRHSYKQAIKKHDARVRDLLDRLAEASSHTRERGRSGNNHG